MFKPNNSCEITSVTGRDIYGQPVFGSPAIEQCAVVTLAPKGAKTPIRGDSSASRGSAMEVQADGIILLTTTTAAIIDAKLTIAGVELRIIGKMPRFNIFGNLDHYEVSCIMWNAA